MTTEAREYPGLGKRIDFDHLAKTNTLIVDFGLGPVKLTANDYSNLPTEIHLKLENGKLKPLVFNSWTISEPE